jgi:hypothetical protein
MSIQKNSWVQVKNGVKAPSGYDASGYMGKVNSIQTPAISARAGEPNRGRMAQVFFDKNAPDMARKLNGYFYLSDLYVMKNDPSTPYAAEAAAAEATIAPAAAAAAVAAPKPLRLRPLRQPDTPFVASDPYTPEEAARDEQIRMMYDRPLSPGNQFGPGKTLVGRPDSLFGQHAFPYRPAGSSQHQIDAWNRDHAVKYEGAMDEDPNAGGRRKNKRTKRKRPKRKTRR